MNLLKETLEKINAHNKTLDDIDFCAVEGSVRNFEYFSKWAEENYSDYDDGYGTNYVPSETCIVFKDKTWLSRGEYDGSEWWDYNQCPAIEDYI